MLNRTKNARKLFRDISFITQSGRCTGMYWIVWLFLASWAIIGSLLVVSGFVDEFEPSTTLIKLNDTLKAWIGVLLVFGVVIVAIGTLNWENIVTKWTLEISGLIVLLVGWLSYILGVIVFSTSWIMTVIGICNLIAVAIRMSVVFQFVRLTERNVKKYKQAVSSAKFLVMKDEIRLARNE